MKSPSRVDERPEAALVGRLERGQVGAVVAIPLLQSERIEGAVAERLDLVIGAGIDESVPDPGRPVSVVDSSQPSSPGS
jgi:hypothetical protein